MGLQELTMFTAEIKALDTAFQALVKRRRGNMVRRGGAGSRDFEISVPLGGHEVLIGVESGWTPEDALFLFVRHQKARLQVTEAHPFFPPRPDGVEEVVGRTLLDALPPRTVKGPGGRAGSAGTASASSRAGSSDGDALIAAPANPGFSVSVRDLNPAERIFQRILGRQIRGDAKRPGWFHVEMHATDTLSEHLPAELREPLTRLINPGPLTHLSIAMTPQVFRIRRSPLLFDIEEIDRFVTIGLDLFSAAALVAPPPAAEVQGLFLLDMLYEAGRGARCGVCGDPASERRVLCSKCLTPAHDECWSYSGGCAVYGCGGTTKTASA